MTEAELIEHEEEEDLLIAEQNLIAEIDAVIADMRRLGLPEHEGDPEPDPELTPDELRASPAPLCSC